MGNGLASDKVMKANANASAELPGPDRQNPEANVGLRLLEDEARVRVDAAVSAQIGFVERLVWFWSNHFCVSLRWPGLTNATPSVRMCLGGSSICWSRSRAIRPCCSTSTTPFRWDRTRLQAPIAIEVSTRISPANPGAPYARGAQRLFAGRCDQFRQGAHRLDLHQHGRDRPWRRICLHRTHAAGAQIVLGKRYPEDGMEQGLAVIADLARHPATARHIARKLAVHFVADEPPPPLLEKLARTFRDSDADLKEMAKALIAPRNCGRPCAANSNARPNGILARCG